MSRLGVKTTPGRVGLYDPKNEKDSCGVGFIADIAGRASRNVVSDANKLLVRMTHRGSKQGEDGDGAGIMVGFPHRFFKKLSLSGQLPFTLPALGHYGVMMIFLPNGHDQETRRAQLMDAIEHTVSTHGLAVLGWRSPLPTKSSLLGPVARCTEPFTVQLFVTRPGDVSDNNNFDEYNAEEMDILDALPSLDADNYDVLSSFSAIDFSLDTTTNDGLPSSLPKDLERLLFLIRRKLAAFTDMYVCSCSSRLLVYKGQVQSEQLFSYYDDLMDEDFTSYLAVVHARFSTNTFPTWDRAHPFRRIAHNGEINTLEANRRWLKAREGNCTIPPVLGLGLRIEEFIPFEEPCHVTKFVNRNSQLTPKGISPSISSGAKLCDSLAIPGNVLAARRSSFHSYDSSCSLLDETASRKTPNVVLEEFENDDIVMSEDENEENLGSNSDSATLDCLIELLMMSGRDIGEAVMMLVPEAPQKDHPKWRKSYNDFLSCVMEPWDGPALVAFTDGMQLGAQLDRNGLRPGRYILSTDDRLILASEVGVVDLPSYKIKQKGRLAPGKMLLIDFREARIIPDEELRYRYATMYPYEKWIDNRAVRLDELSLLMTDDELRRELHLTTPVSDIAPALEDVFLSLEPGSSTTINPNLIPQLELFGFTAEKVELLLGPMSKFAAEALGSMGNDTPLACLSTVPRTPADYCQQLFAQGTNPAIDPIRECNVMSLRCPIGPQGSIFTISSSHARRIFLERPVLTPTEFRCLTTLPGFPTTRIDLVWPRSYGHSYLKSRLEEVQQEAETAVRAGSRMIIMTDRSAGRDTFPLWSTLAVGAVHLHLISTRLRLKCAMVIESGEVCEVHQIAILLSSGADAIYPYMAYCALTRVRFSDTESPLPLSRMIDNYSQAVQLGLQRVLSRMGICTLLSYKGGFFFHPLGMSRSVTKLCYDVDVSLIGGAAFDVLSNDLMRLHLKAYPSRPLPSLLESGKDRLLSDDGMYRFVPLHDAEMHMNHPDTISLLQQAVRSEDFMHFRKFSEIQNSLADEVTLRGQLEFIYSTQRALPLTEVESAKEIVKRFVTSAISLGSISEDAHSAISRAMNLMGSRSNTGEGGEIEDGVAESQRDKIKQIASGRFGVTAAYLCNAEELQIKCGQGAKPGEGGELPGNKVVGKIAAVRRSTPGVGLISPPPHHDMYSIEDVAQLIMDLKHGNPKAKISVKLVAKQGVGIIAAGCVKAKADQLLISGCSGGTGAGKLSGVKHSGLPWELGLAETHQTLCLNSLREKVVLQVDGQMKTGRDVVYAALLGAEEFGFATQPLIALGCQMTRKCHLNACPTGIATQDPELRKRFRGKSEHLVNYFFMVAEEVRVFMSRLGFRYLSQMIGRSDLLRPKSRLREHWKRSSLNLQQLLKPGWMLSSPFDLWRGGAESPRPRPMYCRAAHDHELDKVLDREIIRRVKRSLENKLPTCARLPIRNVDRSVGGLLAYEISYRYGSEGLPNDTITIMFRGSAGQSFACWLPKGVTFRHSGDCNDFVGKGLSGGIIAIKPPSDSPFFEESDKNIIAGNAVLYGATSGRAFFAGVTGERFAVRNSGAVAVVEGCGDYGCEYMTRGIVVVLGDTGRDFAAGMSGGIAYVLNLKKDRVNLQMVDLQPLVLDTRITTGCVEDDTSLETLRTLEISDMIVKSRDSKILKSLIAEHYERTNSTVAKRILDNFSEHLPRFTKVFPKDIQRVLKQAITELVTTGNPEASAILDDWETMTTPAFKIHGFIAQTLPFAFRQFSEKIARRQKQLKRLQIIDLHEHTLKPLGSTATLSAMQQYIAELIRSSRLTDLLSEENFEEFQQIMRMTRAVYANWRTGLNVGLRKADYEMVLDLMPLKLTPMRLEMLKRFLFEERCNLITHLKALEGHALADEVLAKLMSSNQLNSDIDQKPRDLQGSQAWESFLTTCIDTPTSPTSSALTTITTSEVYESPVKSTRPSHFRKQLPAPGSPDVEDYIAAADKKDPPKPFLAREPNNLTGFSAYERAKPSVRPCEDRVLDWEEIGLSVRGSSRLFDLLMKTQAARCMSCGTPTCNYPNSHGGGCPLGNRIPTFNSLVFEGHWKMALECLLETNNFPEFTGRVCPAPCEDSCVLTSRDSAVSIKSIELSIVEKGFQKGWIKPMKPLISTGLSVGIVGSGPAGLSAAQQLNRAGHKVIVYEKSEKVGGLLMYGVPNMKLDKKRVLQRRVDLLEAEGIEFRTSTVVDSNNVNLKTLLDSHNAVLLAVGQTLEQNLVIPGSDLQGIISAMDFLVTAQHTLYNNDTFTAPQQTQKIQMSTKTIVDACGKRVVVIGSGDMAVDVVATVIRMGCTDVVQLVSQSKSPISRQASNPWPGKAHVFRVDYGHEEAIVLQGRDPREYNTKVLGFSPSAKGCSVGGVKVIRVKTGKHSDEELQGTEKIYPADLVILALGFRGVDHQIWTLNDGSIVPLKQDNNLNIFASPGDYKTNVPRLFACGDCRVGPSMVVTAISEGRDAARTIDEYLCRAHPNITTRTAGISSSIISWPKQSDGGIAESLSLPPAGSFTPLPASLPLWSNPQRRRRIVSGLLF